ncbi:MAG: Spore coat associated protein JA (CotJA) [Pelotomaculum sp. PtaB.Bin104]|nr:MAG: Spore coat associated protein JA (CotJA) [Pelotomaculum sp. PtaB.Bin104]
MNSNGYQNPYISYPNMPVMPNAPTHPGGGMPAFQFQLAHAYVPWQYMGQVFSPAEALAHGTLFPELFMPYRG